MKYSTKLEYVDVKNAIESTKQQIRAAEINAQVSKLALKQFEKELAKLPKPKLKKIKEVKITG